MLVAGTSSTNLYTILVKWGWGQGWPEGICHWDGSCWRWVRKIISNTEFVIDMQLVFDQLLLTTSAGNILRMSLDGSALDHAVPSLSEILWKDDDHFDVSFYSSVFPTKDSAVVVGTKGSLYYYDGSRWKRVQTNTTSILNDVLGKLPAMYVIGDGLIGVFDGHEYRQVLKSEGTYYLYGQCIGWNELVLGAKSPSARSSFTYTSILVAIQQYQYQALRYQFMAIVSMIFTLVLAGAAYLERSELSWK